jgi:outer membrane protein assembly factor BamD
MTLWREFRLSTVLRFLLFIALFFGGFQPSISIAETRDESASALYEKGLRAMRRGYYTKALEHFNRVRNYHRDDPVSMQAELAIADLYFKQSDYEAARYAYEDFARLHPRHKDLDYVNFQVGNCHYERAPGWAGRDQRATKQAVKVWSGFAARHVTSTYRPEVEEKLAISRNRLAAKELKIARFYAARDGWLATQKRIERMLVMYPDSIHTADSLSLLGEAYHKNGNPEQALLIRAHLSESFPDAGQLQALDRLLAEPPGVETMEEVFVRPYSYPSTTPGM